MISNGIEPAQNRQRLHLTGWFIVWILHEGSALFGAPSQLLWSARRENISHTHLHPAPSQSRDQGDGPQAIATDIEEVRLRTHRANPQCFSHCLREQSNGFPVTFSIGRGISERAPIRFRQCLPIHFSVGRPRQLIHDGDNRGHHVFGQYLGTPTTDRSTHEARSHRHVAQQSPLPSNHARRLHIWVSHQRRFHVLQLQTHATDFHLIIGPPHEFQRAVVVPAHQVSRAVHPGSVRRKHIRNKAAGRESWGIDIPLGQQESGHIEFTNFLVWNHPQVLIEHIEPTVGIGHTDARVEAILVVTVDDVGDTDGSFRWPVPVVQRDGQLLAKATEQRLGEHLSATPDMPQAV